MDDLIGLEVAGFAVAMEAASLSNPIVPIKDIQAMTQAIAKREAEELEDWFNEEGTPSNS